MTARKMGRTSGYRETPLTLCDKKCNLSTVRRQKARRTSSEHRKVGAREARRETARRTGRKPRERCKAGSRDGSEPRQGHVTGVGRKIRTEVVRVASRWLPWSRRGRLGRGLSDTTPARASGPPWTQPRGAREVSAERLLGVASRLGQVWSRPAPADQRSDGQRAAGRSPAAT